MRWGHKQYKAYHREMSKQDDLTLFHPDHSVRFEGADQLKQLGFLRPEEPLPPVEVPTIASVPTNGAERPFWSVMLTVYDRKDFVARSLESVLQQATDDMQIEVVCDFSTADRQAEIGAEVERVAGDPGALPSA